jgi:predicted dehydrogenase
MNDRLGVSVIGAGTRGIRHADTFTEQGQGRAQIVGLCDTNPANLAKASERFPDACHVSADYREAIDQPDVDAVVIATPNSLHTDPATFAFEKGKHVFCEKPMATTMGDCEKILGAAKASGKILEVGFVLRYAPLFAKIKELIADGEIGRPLLFDWSIHYRGGIHYFRTWHRLKEFSGGLNVEKACHDYDLLNWYFGETPSRVAMWGGLNKFVPGSKAGQRCDTCSDPCEDYNPTMRRGVTESTPDGQTPDGSSAVDCFYNAVKDVGDHYVGMMEYESGLRGTVNMCFYASSPYARSFMVVGTKGEIRGSVHGAHLELHKREKGVAARVFDLRVESAASHHHGGDSRQVSRFLEAIRTNKPGLASGADGLRAVAVGLAMEKSIEEDRSVALSETLDDRWALCAGIER